LSELAQAPVSYAFEQLEPSASPPRDAVARMLAEAASEAEQIREQARVEGYAEGRRAGHEDGSAEISRLAGALGQALQEISSLRAEVTEAVEADAVELALELAGKILTTSLQMRPELILEVVRGALGRVGDRRRITVLVNPVDAHLVRSAIGDLPAHGSGIERCEVQPDEGVGPGGAIVRTVEGEVDASVQTQLERAREVVRTALEAGEPAA
jgi:flagellar assembly protein FliH